MEQIKSTHVRRPWVYVFVVTQQIGNHLHNMVRVVFDGLECWQDEHAAILLDFTSDQ